MKFHSAISDHESSDEAVAELIRSARARIDNADVAFVFFTGDHREQAGTIVEQLWLELDPKCLVGCSAEGVIGSDREIERSPGMSLLIGELPGVNVHPFHIAADDWRPALLGDEPQLAERLGVGPLTRGVIGFGDPFTTPLNQLLASMNQLCPGVPLIGGMASSARGPGENVLLRNDQTLDDGMVGVSLSGALTVDTVVSQGCRPIGRPMIVTKAKGNVVEALGGKPPLLVLRELVQDMPESEQELLRNGLFLGKAISEYRETFGRGDFLVRNLIGADDSNGAVAVNGEMRVGQTVQFHVRDADTADEDLRELLARHGPVHPAGALLFSCNGRGTRMFQQPCHDVGVSRELLPATPVAGFFAAGELGPVGGDNFVHGHTASFAILREAR
jgi:small ligand-binding sensory domain FIST